MEISRYKWATQASGAHDKVKLKGPSLCPGQENLIRAMGGGIYLKGMPKGSRYKDHSSPVSIPCHEGLYTTSVLLISCKCCFSGLAELICDM